MRRACISFAIVGPFFFIFLCFVCVIVDAGYFSVHLGLEIPELKAAALEHIRCSLTPENVVTEICSPFTARFPEVRKIEREYLKANWVRQHCFSPICAKKDLF